MMLTSLTALCCCCGKQALHPPAVQQAAHASKGHCYASLVDPGTPWCACMQCSCSTLSAAHVLLFLQDSRSSSPGRSSQGLQTQLSTPAAVQGTDSGHGPSTAATHEQQQESPAAQPTIANGTTAAAAAAPAASTTVARPPSVTWQDLQQPAQQQPQLDPQLAATNGTADTSSSLATNGVNGSRPVPPVPPLAPGSVPVRTSSAGVSSCNSRRQSLLGDAGRASSHTSACLTQAQQLDTPAQLEQSSQQQQPARPQVSQLPLHLVRTSMDSPSPPSVAMQQVGVGRKHAVACWCAVSVGKHSAHCSTLMLYIVACCCRCTDRTAVLVRSLAKAPLCIGSTCAHHSNTHPECACVLPPYFLQVNSPDVTPQQQQQQQSPAQPFWQSSNWSFGTHCEQNKRRHMEDRFAAVDLTAHVAFGAAQRAGFFAVYDGHSGAEAAEYLESHLQAYVLAAGSDALAANPLQVLSDAVQKAEAEILASYEAGKGSDTAGSTLCAILLVDDKLHVAHVGDSRAVLGRGAEPIQLTRDHKPGCEIEAARIEQVRRNLSGFGFTLDGVSCGGMRLLGAAGRLTQGRHSCVRLGQRSHAFICYVLLAHCVLPACPCIE